MLGNGVCCAAGAARSGGRGRLHLNSSGRRGPVPAGELTVQVVRSGAGVALLESDFAHLQSVTGNTLPFALFEWHLAWCRHFLRQERGVEDQPMYHVVRDPEGACVGVIPLILTRRRIGGLTFASAGLLGAGPAITEILSSLSTP